MVEAASLALADSLNEEERALDMIYPRIERIRDISALIALRVIRAAQKDVSTPFIVFEVYKYSPLMSRALIKIFTFATRVTKSSLGT